MKRAVSLAFVFLFATCLQVSAQRDRSVEGFEAFLTKFRSTVVKNDKEAVANMTMLPFLFENNELERAEFIKIYEKLFDSGVRKCFADAKPMKEGDVYEVFCAKRIFYFGKVDGEFKFTEFGVDY